MQSTDCNGTNLTVIWLWTREKMFLGGTNLALQSGSLMSAFALGGSPVSNCLNFDGGNIILWGSLLWFVLGLLVGKVRNMKFKMYGVIPGNDSSKLHGYISERVSVPHRH
ncbi:hypothetical protein TNCV_1822611 [Trichonephila clavipes]|uniref:Transmembrane protein n=1 Tax=Trichonephila clavipes TaxID=2585209 RepID=A0A8X6S880_TRICX|nr:hypothetical protein TNCV_1822611 [Trichonephila clavipes]